MIYNSLDHSRVACQQPCTHEIPDCDCACIRTCGIRHVHTCECTKKEVATVNNRRGLLIEFEIQRSDRTSLIQGSASNVPPTVEAWRNLSKTGKARSFQKELNEHRQARLSRGKQQPIQVTETFTAVRTSKPKAPAENPAVSPPHAPAEESSTELPLLLDLDYSSDERAPVTGNLLD